MWKCKLSSKELFLKLQDISSTLHFILHVGPCNNWNWEHRKRSKLIKLFKCTLTWYILQDLVILKSLHRLTQLYSSCCRCLDWFHLYKWSFLQTRYLLLVWYLLSLASIMTNQSTDWHTVKLCYLILNETV